jgi:hypothetical protein
LCARIGDWPAATSQASGIARAPPSVDEQEGEPPDPEELARQRAGREEREEEAAPARREVVQVYQREEEEDGDRFLIERAAEPVEGAPGEGREQERRGEERLARVAQGCAAERGEQE